jgi:hypothetical protein
VRANSNFKKFVKIREIRVQRVLGFDFKKALNLDKVALDGTLIPGIIDNINSHDRGK